MISSLELPNQVTRTDLGTR